MLLCLSVADNPQVRDMVTSSPVCPQGPVWTICNWVAVPSESQGESQVIFMADKVPVIGTFVSPVFETFTYIPLLASAQGELRQLLYQDTEYSGYLDAHGTVCNLQQGTIDWAPLQPTRSDTKLPFHTHPKAAYQAYNAKYGWPSEGDIMGVTAAKDNKVISHLVVSLEGIYLMLDTTCKAPMTKNKHHDKADLMTNLTNCSWLLLPWTNQDWYMY